MNNLNLNAAPKHVFARRKTVARARRAHRARHLLGHALVDRLTHEVDHISVSLWTYDLNGNRTSVTLGSNTYGYAYQTTSNRLTSVAGPIARTYTYDAAGNIKGDNTHTFTYNAGGRLSKVVRSGQTNEYKHNAMGQRVIKRGSYLTNSPYLFLYDEAGHLVGEYDASNALRQETVWLGDTPVAVLKKNAQGQIQTYAIHADHLDTPRAILDSQNRMVWRWLGSAFGQNLPDEDPDGDGTLFEYNLRFPGQYWDKETGLHYNYFRDYDPSSGRYAEADPIGIAGGLNVYLYGANDPVSQIDPLGLANGPAVAKILSGGSGQSGNGGTANFSIGAGGSGMFMFNYAGADSGIAMDTAGTFCFYSTICTGFGANTPVAGELGAVFSAGQGKLCSGEQKSQGGYWQGGEGLLGQGQVLFSADSGQYNRGLFGVGGQAGGAGPMGGAGYVSCRTTLICPNEPPKCGCDGK